MSFLKRFFHKRDDCAKEYEISSVLGSGSFATVKKATCRTDKSDWAVKIIDKSSLNKDDEDALAVEVEILGQLNHPNIVRLRETYDCKKKFYMVMELMTGGELFDRIVSKEKFSEEEARIVVRKITEALYYCHSQGIAHRDLKPENLLFSNAKDDADIKIADFGLAKLLKESDMMATACGTPGYVAPEILSGLPYTDKVDIWSLGVIVYILLCGFPPFYDENNAVLFQQIKAGAYDYPSPYWDAISDSAKDLIDRMLVVDPTRRYSAADVLSHPWVCETQSDKSLESTQEEMRKYQLRRRFRITVLKARAVDMFRSGVIDSGNAAKLQEAAAAVSSTDDKHKNSADASSSTHADS